MAPAEDGTSTAPELVSGLEPQLLDEPRGLARPFGVVCLRPGDLLGDPRRHEAEQRRASRRAARLAPDAWQRAPDVVALAGSLAARRADDGTAERYLRITFEVLPDYAEHGRDLADFLLNRARPAEALEVIAKAMHLSPHDEELKRLQRRILAAFHARPS